jgi:hypothetical protein
MSEFEFRLATASDDAKLRARMAADWMDGRIAVSFRREPCFFAGASLQGNCVQTVVCTEVATGQLVGLGTRASGAAYVNGVAQRIGYLADLRCARQYRRGTLLARGYRFLRDLHRADPLPFYTTVIYEGNRQALDVLASARAGLPVYRAHGRLMTPVIRLDRVRHLKLPRGIEIVQGERHVLSEITAFLNRQLATRQFAPCYQLADFAEGRLRALGAGDFLIARRGRNIAGTIALWDQSAFRQTHVEHYSGMLRIVRPIYNAWAVARRGARLPAPGERLRAGYLSCLAVAEDALDVGRALLSAACHRARARQWHFAIAGLHERDPLAPLLSEFARIEAAGRLFVVVYPDDAPRTYAFDDRVPYLEAGCL